MDDPRLSTQRLAEEYRDRGDPNGWFEEFYARAGGDANKVYWADLAPGPHLLSWTEGKSCTGARAITVGCGVGDDAEALAERGYEVTVFDISTSAISMCRARFPERAVSYMVADLFGCPDSWKHAFDLVYECNTIQSLKGQDMVRALEAIAQLVAPGGEVLVSCRSRVEGSPRDVYPLALDRHEIDGFVRSGLRETYFEAYDDSQEPPVPHFFAVYGRQERK